MRRRTPLMWCLGLCGVVSVLFSGQNAVLGERFQIDSYVLNTLILTGINVVLAVSLNFVSGHTGQFSLGHAGFMAIGAYASAVGSMAIEGGLVKSAGWAGWAVQEAGWLCCLVLGGVLAGLFGLLVGLPSLRLKGDYLAIVTLGFGEIIRVVIQNTEWLGGARGLSGVPVLTSLGWTFGIVFLALYVVGSLVDSSYGRGFLAVRDNEVAAEAVGVDTTRYKVVAFTVGAFFAGLAGGLYAHFIGYLNPEGFGFSKSIDVVVMVIVGGLGSTAGVAAAAVGLSLLNEFLREAEYFRMVFFSLILIGMMILRPQGFGCELRGILRRLGLKNEK
jgi:branched-chain amino acid transport system permease protein